MRRRTPPVIPIRGVTRLIKPEGRVGLRQPCGEPTFRSPEMTIARSAGYVLENHATLELVCLDRLYLDAFVPLLRTGAGTAWFFREVRAILFPHRL